MVDEQQHRPTLIQLVPQLWAASPNGVTDHALTLARALDACGVNSVFLSGAPSTQLMSTKVEWKSASVPRRQAQSLADMIETVSTASRAQAVLLHFSGYGYQKRGVPLWLANGLRIWRRRTNQVPLFTIFHELYATSQPWHSAFWLCPLQKHIVRRIFRLSAGAITSTRHFRERLLGLGDRGVVGIKCMPVFSNVGEAGRGRSPGARAGTAVVFGRAGVEDRLFGIYRSEIARIVRLLGIEEIIDIGPRCSSLPRDVAGVPVISKGVLPDHDVSDLLQQARFGFIAYPLDFIGKSGVFAAYAAHGVVPIVLSDEQVCLDGLRPSQHFIDGLRLTTDIGVDDLAWIQDELFVWYMSHSLNALAGYLEKSISGGFQI